MQRHSQLARWTSPSMYALLCTVVDLSEAGHVGIVLSFHLIYNQSSLHLLSDVDRYEQCLC